VLRHPESHYDLVRPGIALYGIGPAPDEDANLRPALTWRSTVAFARPLAAGERVSYGLRYELGRDAVVATVPVGYADGYPRAASSRADVLIRGRRCRVAGSVTMDQLIVDCGDLAVAAGDEVVLLGRQGDDEITAWEFAANADTIAYEIVSRIGERVPRTYTGASP
jgi:alanine racemase